MEFGKLTAIFDADTKRFDAGLRGVQGKLSLVTKDIRATTLSTGNLTSATGSATSGLGIMGGALGVTAGAAIGAAAAISAAGAGIFKLATFSQELAGELFDLSEKINFSVETLSDLKLAAELSGGSLASLSTSLGIFDRNMEEAKDKTSEMSRVFKALKINTDDNEKALRQAFTALSGMAKGSQQTALAMKLFGRSGKEVLGIIKETNGNVEEFSKQMGGAGHITTEAAKKADEFDKKMVILRTKLEDVARQIGSELVPTVEKAADDISNWLKQNQGEIIKTAKELGSLVSDVYAFAKLVSSPFVMQIIITRKIKDVVGEAGGISGMVGDVASASGTVPGQMIGAWLKSRGRPGKPAPAGPEVGGSGSLFGNLGGDIDLGKNNKTGGGGKRRIDDSLRDQQRLDEAMLSKLKTRLDSEEKEVSRSYDRRKIVFSEYISESIRLERERYDEVKANLEKEQSLAKAALDQNIADTQASMKKRGRSKEDIDKVTGSLKLQLALQEASNNLDEEKFRHGARLQDIEGERLDETKRINEELDKQVANYERILDLVQQARDAMEFGPVTTATGELEKFMENGPPDISAQSQAILDARERMRDAMMQLGDDITSVFANAVGDGFEQGAKRGLQTLAQGMLSIVQDIFLKRLADGLGQALGGIGGGGGGGSWWQKLIGIGIGAIAGGFGGGGAAGGGLGRAVAGIKLAKGGVVPGDYKGYDSVPAMLSPGETVIPRGGMSGKQIVNHISVNMPPAPRGSVSSRQSRRQQAEQVAAVIQGALA